MNRISRLTAARRTSAVIGDRLAAESMLRDIAFVLEMTRKAQQIDTAELWLRGGADADQFAEPAFA